MLVKNEQEVKKGEKLAETVTVSEHGGEVKSWREPCYRKLNLKVKILRKSFKVKSLQLLLRL